jgi:hemerythrin-like metal-binding protein
VLNALVDYTRHHFAREELLMAHFDVPERQHHARVHRRLEGQVRHIRDTLRTSPERVVTEEILDFLRNWLIDHIRGHDLSMRPHITDPADADRLLEGRLLVDIRNPGDEPTED